MNEFHDPELRNDLGRLSGPFPDTNTAYATPPDTSDHAQASPRCCVVRRSNPRGRRGSGSSSTSLPETTPATNPITPSSGAAPESVGISDNEGMTTDWNPVLRDQLAKPYWADLQRFVRVERESHTVYPPNEDVFAALHLTSLASTRVVILGQDPYHGPRQAHGLCFSVRRGVAIPPSLANVHTELHSDLAVPTPTHGNLEAWALQGVLLLNTTLTVRAGQAASHQGKGWEVFTDEVLRIVDALPHPVVFVLWGASARKKTALIDTSRHVVIESAHPSPLSAHNGFFGSKPFSRTNAALRTAGFAEIDWRLPD
jgi:uracil-DNA glycosylase